jgi:DNA-binding XRE family transcriptional regulator
VDEAGDFTSLIGIPLQSPVLQQAGAFLLGQDAELKAIPVVAVTAFAMRGDEERTDIDAKIGARLAEVRRWRGLTQRQLAKAVGVTITAIQNLGAWAPRQSFSLRYCALIEPHTAHVRCGTNAISIAQSAALLVRTWRCSMMPSLTCRKCQRNERGAWTRTT